MAEPYKSNIRHFLEGALPANVWRPVEGEEGARIVTREDVETFRAPTGKLWYRWRTDQEAAELRLLQKEHSPNAERMRQAQTICPPAQGKKGDGK